MSSERPPLLLAAAGVAAWLLGLFLRSQPLYAEGTCGLPDLVSVYVWQSLSEEYCSELPWGLLAVLGCFLLGLVLVGSSALIGTRRGRVAAAGGHPWPVRRRLERVASALDQKLPGYHEELPRVPTWPLTAGLLLVVAGAVVGTGWLWQQHQQSQRHEKLVAAQQALAALQLPQGVERTSGGAMVFCTQSPSLICARSDRPPDDLIVELTHLIKGSRPTRYGGSPEMVSILGTVGGFPAEANVSRDILRIERVAGKPRPVYGGSFIMLYLTEPP